MANITKKLFDSTAAETIQVFLKNPGDRKSFDRFFNVCYYHTIGYLRYLKAKGVPIELHDADEQKSLSDTAYDILGEFFRSGKNKPFFIIFDYFRRHKIDDFDKIDSEGLYKHFTVLLLGFIRKTLFRRRSEENRQDANLEKNIKVILKRPEYTVFKSKHDKTDYVCLIKNKDNLRPEKRQLLIDDLHRLVLTAFSEKNSSSDVELVFKTFEELNRWEEHRNFIKKYDLIRAVKNVIKKQVEIDGLWSSDVPTPDNALLRSKIDKATAQSLTYAGKLIDEHIGKGRISDNEGKLIYQAVAKYLTDFAYDGQTDKIPTYFFDIMPQCGQKEYQKKYKYVLDAVIGKTLESFKNHLRNIL